jgi:transposase
MTPEAPQRVDALREVGNARRWIVHTGAPWRYLPGALPPWQTVDHHTRRWLDTGVFPAMVHDLRDLLRWVNGRSAQPTAVIVDRATRQSSPESGHRAGDDGSKRRQGSTFHAAVDTLGHVLAVLVTPADTQDREQIAARAAAVQEVTGQTVEVAFVDQGDTGDDPTAAAAEQGIRLEVVKPPAAKRGVVLLPQRWVVARSFAWAVRFRRLAKDDERLPEVVAGVHFLAFATLMLHRVGTPAVQSP